MKVIVLFEDAEVLEAESTPIKDIVATTVHNVKEANESTRILQ